MVSQKVCLATIIVDNVEQNYFLTWNFSKKFQSYVFQSLYKWKDLKYSEKSTENKAQVKDEYPPPCNNNKIGPVTPAS